MGLSHEIVGTAGCRGVEHRRDDREPLRCGARQPQRVLQGELRDSQRVGIARGGRQLDCLTSPPDSDVVRRARQAVELATTAGDAHALAVAQLALQDSLWLPGTALQRLPVIAAMLGAATACGDNDLVAGAHLLQSAALLELGDPAGRDELLTYITLAGELGHARGRWGALTRQATFAQLAGRAEESARFSDRALELGLAIGEPDAMGCFCTSRWSLVALGVRAPDMSMDAGDPLWPMFPLLKASPSRRRRTAGRRRGRARRLQRAG